MEKTKDQILMEKLRQASRLLRGDHPGRRPGPMGPMGPGMGPGPRGGFPRPGMGMGGPHFGPGPMGMGPMRPQGPGMGHGPKGPHGHGGRPFPRERVLLALLEADEAGLRQTDVAKALGIGPSALSEQIDRLEADRYLERTANPEDKRSTLLRLTEKGRARAYEVSDQRAERAAEFCSRLTDEEKDTLIALLDKLLAKED